MTKTDEKQNIYSPWMDNWKENVDKPRKSVLELGKGKHIKILLWVGFFSLLVSPVAILVIGTFLKSSGIKEYKPAPFTESDAKRLIEETESNIHRGAFKAAIHRANYVITENPDIPRIYVLAGLASFHLNEYQEAIEYANEALKVNPNYNSAKYLLAMCSYSIDPDASRSTLPSIYYDDYVYTYYFGALYMELVRDYSGMLAFADKGVQFDVNSPLMLFTLARAQFVNAQFKKTLDTIETIKEVSKFTELSASAIWVRSEILKAETLLKLDEIEEAEITLLRYYNTYTRWWQLLRVYAMLNNSNAKYAVTIKMLKRFEYPLTLKNKDFDVIEMYMLRGYALLQERQFTDATSNFQNIIKIKTGIDDVSDIALIQNFLTPACHKAMLRLAQLEQKRGNLAEAQDYLRFIESVFLDVDETDELNKLTRELAQ